MTTTVDVAWLNYHADSDIIARGYWDQGLLELFLAGDRWRMPAMPTWVHHEGERAVLNVPYGAGAVVVVPARHHALDAARINAEIRALPWVVLFLLGDEESLFPWQELAHPNMELWVMHPRPGYHEARPNVHFIGDGYRSDVPALIAAAGEHAALRPYRWFYSGQVTHMKRVECVKALRSTRGGQLTETPGFTQGLAHDVYARGLASARFAPAPSGPQTQDTFRVYEALEAGCVPIVDRFTPDHRDGFWEMTWGGVPFPEIADWGNVGQVMSDLDGRWHHHSAVAQAWWLRQKRWMAKTLRDQLPVVGAATVNDDITVLVPTSPIGVHPSSDMLATVIDSVRWHLPTADIIVMCDGVRSEQRGYQERYERYLYDVCWRAQHEWVNVLPVIHDRHMHQANMTRHALAELVDTSLVLFVEHDTPLVTDCGPIPFDTLAADMGDRWDVVRFYHEAVVPRGHEHLVDELVPGGVTGTRQWSQRPHLASAAYYRDIIARHFPRSCSTMIEDKMHSVAQVGPGRHRIGIYTPDTPHNMKRSYDLDGRGGDEKYAMRFE